MNLQNFVFMAFMCTLDATSTCAGFSGAYRMEQKLLELRGITREEQLYSTSATPLAVRSSTSTVPVRGSGLPNPAHGPQGRTHYSA